MPGTPLKIVRFESSLPKPPTAGRFKYFAPGWRLALVGHFQNGAVNYTTSDGIAIDPERITATMLPQPYRWQQHCVRRQKRGNTIFVTRSERDCLSLFRCRIASTTGPAGRWLREWNHLLAAGTVCVLAGRDQPGQEWALQVAGMVAPVARTRIVTLPAEGPNVVTRWALLNRLPCRVLRDVLDSQLMSAPDFGHP